MRKRSVEISKKLFSQNHLLSTPNVPRTFPNTSQQPNKPKNNVLTTGGIFTTYTTITCVTTTSCIFTIYICVFFTTSWVFSTYSCVFFTISCVFFTNNCISTTFNYNVASRSSYLYTYTRQPRIHSLEHISKTTKVINIPARLEMVSLSVVPANMTGVPLWPWGTFFIKGKRERTVPDWMYTKLKPVNLLSSL